MRAKATAGDALHTYFVFWDDVKIITDSSESTIRRAIRRKEFPAPISIFGNKGRVGFRRADVYLWCEGKWSPEGAV